ncbi:MAG: hypothetical protein CMJ85_07330 [Planctomycetes bacterium]|nr:hypothetical protein [Planctomycetota bacterium]
MKPVQPDGTDTAAETLAGSAVSKQEGTQGEKQDIPVVHLDKGEGLAGKVQISPVPEYGTDRYRLVTPYARL